MKRNRRERSEAKERERRGREGERVESERSCKRREANNFKIYHLKTEKKYR